MGEHGEHRGSADTVSEALAAQRRALTADLDGYIERRAAELAQPLVVAAEERARQSVKEAQRRVELLEGVVGELREHLATRTRQLNAELVRRGARPLRGDSR